VAALDLRTGNTASRPITSDDRAPRPDAWPLRVEYRPWSIVRAVGIFLGAGAAVVLIWMSSTVLLWLAIASVLAALFYPVLDRLKRRLPNALALIVLVLVVLGMAATVSYRGFAEVQNQTQAVQTQAADAASELEQSPRYGSVATEFALSAKVQTFFSSLPVSNSGSGDLTGAVGSVASSGSALFAVTMLALLMLIFGQTMLSAGIEQVEQPRRRYRVRALIHAAYDATSRYAWLMIGRAAAIGIGTGLISLALGFGTPTVVGLWFAILSVIPALGILLATLPIAVLLVPQSPVEALAVLLVAIAVQAVDAAVVQRRIDAASVHVGPFPTVLAVMLGFQLYGVGGVLLALAVTAFVVAALKRLTQGEDDLLTALRQQFSIEDPTVVPTSSAADEVAVAGVTVEADGQATRQVELGLRTPLIAAATLVGFLAVFVVVMSGPAVALTGLGVLFAFAVDPLVGRLERALHLRRGFAVALVCGVLAAVAIGGVVAFGPSSVEQARSFQDDLPKVVDQLADLPVVGGPLAEQQAPEKVRSWAADLPKQMGHDTSSITMAATTALQALFAGIVVFVLMITALIDGPRMVRGLQRVPSRHRLPVLQRAGALVGQSVGRYFSGSLLLAGLQAAQVLITGLALGVPLSPLLAVWAGVWNLVPQAGGAIGGSLFVLVAFTQGATTGFIAAAVFGIYLVIANNVLLPVIVGKAVDLSPVSTMVATIGGFTVGGIIGAMVAVPILGAGKAIYAELKPDRAARRRASRDRSRGRVRATTQRMRERATG